MTEDERRAFGGRVRRARYDRALLWEMFAQLVQVEGVNGEVVRDLELGRMEPSRDVIAALERLEAEGQLHATNPDVADLPVGWKSS